MRPVHAGEVLREEHLRPLEMSVNALAKWLGISTSHLNDVVLERRGVTPDTTCAFRAALAAMPAHGSTFRPHTISACSRSRRPRRSSTRLSHPESRHRRLAHTETGRQWRNRMLGAATNRILRTPLDGENGRNTRIVSTNRIAQALESGETLTWCATPRKGLMLRISRCGRRQLS